MSGSTKYHYASAPLSILRIRYLVNNCVSAHVNQVTVPWKFALTKIQMFILAIVLFVVFTLVHITRLICFPRSAYQQTVSDHEQTCLWGCASIGLLTITTQISLTASTAKWGYHDLSVVAYVIWWIATACMVTTAMVVYIFLIKTKHTKDVTLTAAILIPAVGTMTDALVGGIICTYSSDLSARMAVPVIVVSYMLLGYENPEVPLDEFASLQMCVGLRYSLHYAFMPFFSTPSSPMACICKARNIPVRLVFEETSQLTNLL